MGGKEFSDSMPGVSEPLWKTKEYNDFDWLYPASLDKAMKEDELRDSNSRLQMCINSLKSTKCALKEKTLLYPRG